MTSTTQPQRILSEPFLPEGGGLPPSYASSVRNPHLRFSPPTDTPLISDVDNVEEPRVSTTGFVHKGPALGVRTVDQLRTVDWMGAAIRDKRSNKQRSKEFTHLRCGRLSLAYESMQGWLLLAIIGFVIGVIAGLTAIGVDWVSDLKVGFCPSHLWLNHKLCCQRDTDPALANCTSWVSWSTLISQDYAAVIGYAVYVAFAVVFALFSGWLVKTFSIYAAGSGIPEVKTILGGFSIKGFLGGWTLLIKTVGMIYSVGAGLHLGKEGPFIHLACCVGNVLSRISARFYQSEVRKREILAAAGAAGLTVAFGAPIGGVLFSLEELSSYFPHKTMWRSFFCCIFAALTVSLIDPFHTHKLVLFEVTYTHNWGMLEIFPFILLGMAGGLYGAFFIKMNLTVCALRKRFLKMWPMTEIAVLAFVTGLVNYTSPYLIGTQTDLLSGLFGQCDQLSVDDQALYCNENIVGWIMLGLLIAGTVKIIFTIFTIGIKVPAGLLIPSLSIGACFGRVLGICVKLAAEKYPMIANTYAITPGIYAAVGAAAFLGGVTRMTVSLVVIMFELTGGLEIVLPVMIGVIFAKWVGDAFGREGIYERQIVLSGYPYLDMKAEVADDVYAADVMTSKDLFVLPLHGHTVDSLTQVLQTTYQGYPVVTSHGDSPDLQDLLVGYVSRRDLEHELARALQRPEVFGNTRCYFSLNVPFSRGVPYVDLSHILDQVPVQVAEHTPLDRIFDMFAALGLRYCVITRYGKLCGIIKKKDILQKVRALEEEERWRD